MNIIITKNFIKIKSIDKKRILIKREIFENDNKIFDCGCCGGMGCGRCM